MSSFLLIFTVFPMIRENNELFLIYFNINPTQGHRSHMVLFLPHPRDAWKSHLSNKTFEYTKHCDTILDFSYCSLVNGHIHIILRINNMFGLKISTGNFELLLSVFQIVIIILKFLMATWIWQMETLILGNYLLTALIVFLFCIIQSSSRSKGHLCRTRINILTLFSKQSSIILIYTIFKLNQVLEKI